MNIIKKAINNINNCEVRESGISINGKIYEDDIVDFPTEKIKKYTLKSVLFYLLHKTKDLEEYMKLCQQNQLQPITYFDQKSIMEDLSKILESSSNGFFQYPVYTNNKKYFIPNFGNTYIIIVPNNILCSVNITNFYELFCSDISFSSHKNYIKKNGNIYLIYDSIDKLTENDWNKVMAIFIDEIFDSDSILEIKKVEELRIKNKVFKANDKTGRFRNIIFKDGIVQNKDQIWWNIEN